MTICADFLHMPLGGFRALPKYEQAQWRIFVQERWRRTAALQEEATSKVRDKKLWQDHGGG